MAKAKVQTQTENETENGGNDRAAKKVKCPVSRKEFAKEAKGLAVTISKGGTQTGNTDLLVPIKDGGFSTGSFGWYTNEKIIVWVGNTPVKVQLAIQATVVDSKNVEE